MGTGFFIVTLNHCFVSTKSGHFWIETKGLLQLSRFVINGSPLNVDFLLRNLHALVVQLRQDKKSNKTVDLFLTSFTFTPQIHDCLLKSSIKTVLFPIMS